MSYRIKANASYVTINGKRIHVDSQLEGRVLHELEASGFHDRWQRTEIGVTIGNSRYTPDLDLAVEYGGKTQRVPVEIKPYKLALTPSTIKRIIGVSSYYKTDLFLLYAGREKMWYRFDYATQTLIEFGLPVPGVAPLSKLPKTISLSSQKFRGKYYQRKLNPVGWFADLVIELIQGPKPKRRYRRRK